MLSCQNSNHKDIEYAFQNIEEKIKTPINNEESEEINMSKLTPFIWSRLYIFKPYTPIDRINDKLGFIWEGAEKTHISQDDNFSLLVFTEKKKVIHYIKWPREKGDFMKIKKIKYSYDSAIFILKMDKYGNQDWLFLHEKCKLPYKPNCLKV
ncbi:hypothetical protein [Tenacibaculum maritimum]|uniref:hypothetical protein n=1 Tax=Tenacibaculum maritimum TaxID=107401 RepID=UPI00132F9C08|nr:hypothetical protein [Tenacibaculum maritimum]